MCGIAILNLSNTEFGDLVAAPFVDDVLAGDDPVTMVVIDDDPERVPDPGALPVIVAVVTDDPEAAAALATSGGSAADVVVSVDDIDDLRAGIERAPIAATSLAVLLRSVAQLEVDHALAAESAVYATLQSGIEFAEWRMSHPTRPDSSDEPTVVVERHHDILAITLNRPHRHNAISTRLRDELCAALAIAIADESITLVVLDGAGPSFCSGGDLDEFGSRPDAATAHRSRLTRSPARMIHRLSRRTEVRIHGSTLGGGIELAAFASRVSAHPDTVIGLPELAIGLIPGAGGTVSLTRRIGRHRTAWMALTGRRIDAQTAVGWGLVDDVSMR